MKDYKKKYLKLKKMLERWTRAEIIARHGKFDNLEFGDYYTIKLEIEDKLRKKLFGTDDLVELGIKWKLLKESKKKK